MRGFRRSIFAVAMATLLGAGLSVASDAAPRVARSADYDGLWSVSIATLRGDCSPSYRYPVRIVDGRVVQAYADVDYRVYGVVGRGGSIGVTVSHGGQTANGHGRLSGDSGRGWWRTASGECSGQWTAARRD
jgi:hypothetical protein